MHVGDSGVHGTQAIYAAICWAEVQISGRVFIFVYSQNLHPSVEDKTERKDNNSSYLGETTNN